MYSVIVADDEPVALDNICTLIEARYPDFSVISTAEDGAQALKLAQELHPDVVMTDIRMPGMDGIQLVKSLHESSPDTVLVLISGYQDFCYAQDAIRAGVSDYILKPVVPADFRNTMSAVRIKLEKLFCARRARLLRAICNGEMPDSSELAVYFPDEQYFLLLERKNSLPRRFDINGSGIEITSLPNERVIMYGRDEREALCLYPEASMSEEDLLELAGSFAFAQENNTDGYATAAVCSNAVSRSGLPDAIPGLYRMLGAGSVIGKSQVLRQEKSLDAQDSGVNTPDTLLKMMFLVKEVKLEAAKKELHRLLELWRAEQRTQLWLERQIRQKLYIAESCRSSTSSGAEHAECEFLRMSAVSEPYVPQLRGTVFQQLSYVTARRQRQAAFE